MSLLTNVSSEAAAFDWASLVLERHMKLTKSETQSPSLNLLGTQVSALASRTECRVVNLASTKLWDGQQA